MIGLQLKTFQQKAVDYLFEHSQGEQAKKQIILKSPTGSGKTILLIKFIEDFLAKNPEMVFVWFTVGKGDLEEQSRDKMLKFSDERTGDLNDVLTSGFQNGTSYFINWETVTKKGNLALRESERKNWFDQTTSAHRNGQKFIVIIDEEHQNNTAKASDIIASLAAQCEIRVSATPASSPDYEIKEIDVINEGLITRAMYINRDLEVVQAETTENETALLLEKADEVRKQIAAAYLQKNTEIRPLVLIQFPNLNDDLIEFVENWLAEKGYNYENRMVASWFSAETKQDKDRKSKKLGKINIGEIDTEESITRHNAEPVFLLFKQALATGWDCPRAKILVKLRENMSESFEIQTLGRLRRMPEAKHYDQDILDCSFLYTFDEAYKNAAIKSGGQEVKRVKLKGEPQSFVFHSEQRDRDGNFADLNRVHKDLRTLIVQRFNLTENNSKQARSENRQILLNNGFEIGETVNRRYLQGRFITFDDIEQENAAEYGRLVTPINTHEHGLDLRQKLDELKKHTRLDYETTRRMLESLFLSEINRQDRLLDLNRKEFYSLILNNGEKWHELLKNFATSQVQEPLPWGKQNVRESQIKIPKDEIYAVNWQEQSEPFVSNVYHDYGEEMLAVNRSTPERLFERFCETSDKVKYCYKNGDSGGQYLSIVYTIGSYQQRLFYPDYIVQLQDGRFWLIETKGGEQSGKSKNIDDYSELKFNAMKQFAEKHSYGFAFVRDKLEKLYFCNETYSEEMGENWQKLDNLW